MQSSLVNPEATLNDRIAKQLIWRRNAPYFYQTLYVQELTWPSLAVEWWVDESCSQRRTSDETTLAYLCYGTHTSKEQPNYLVMAKVYLPNQEYIKKTLRERPAKVSECVRKNDSHMEDKIVVQHEIEHEGEVNRIKHHPKISHLIATRTPLGQVHVFDKLKFKTGRVKLAPSLVLAGHETQGYALQWNHHKENMIVAGSYDGKLSMWDINMREERKIQPLCEFSFHERQIEDISHNRYHDSIFASCDDGGHTALWDIRHPSLPLHNFQTSTQEQRCVQFAPLNRHVFATGGADCVIRLYDVRNMSQSLVEMETQEGISQLCWSSSEREVMWSSSGRVISMWDLEERKVKWVHAGHMENINQMDVHPFDKDTIAAVDNGNDIQVFQPTPNAHL